MPAAVPQETAEPHAVARSVWTLVSKTSHHYTVTIGHTRKLRYRQNLSTCPLVMGRCRYLTSVSVFGVGISKYRDIGSVFRYFSWSTLRVTDKLGFNR